MIYWLRNCNDAIPCRWHNYRHPTDPDGPLPNKPGLCKTVSRLETPWAGTVFSLEFPNL